MTEIISLLGSTGSIGTQTLNVAKLHNIKINALSAHRNITLLEQQARAFQPKMVCIYDKERYTALKSQLRDTSITVISGMEGLLEIAAQPVDKLVNAVVGMVGLRPTLCALENGNAVALANKETLVVGGALVMEKAKQSQLEILPIDSEHSAIFQCLQGNTVRQVSKILLTASGGPFYGYTADELKQVTKERALKHPNWEMGAKITIDSATMMNKGLEFIEAMWLFGVTPEQIDILIHRQSIVHSAVEFCDGSVIAQMGVPDMRIPIQYALTYPERMHNDFPKLNLAEAGSLTFAKPDESVFLCLPLARAAANKGGNAPCIINCANEYAVEAFLQDKIPFCRIQEIISAAYHEIPYTDTVSLAVIEETQAQVKDYVSRCITKN